MKTFLITIGFIIIILWIYKLSKYNDYTEKLTSNNNKTDVSNNPINSETETNSGMNKGMIAIIAIVSVIVLGIIIFYIVKSTSKDEEGKGSGSEEGRRGSDKGRRGNRRDRDSKRSKDYKDKGENKKKGKSLLKKVTDYIGDTYGKYKANKRRIKRIKYNEPRGNKDYSIFNAMLPVLLASTPTIRNIYNSRFECLDYNSPNAQKQINALYEGSSPNLTQTELEIVKTLKFIDMNELSQKFKYEKVEPKRQISKEEIREAAEARSDASDARKTAAKEFEKAKLKIDQLKATGNTGIDKEIAELELEIASIKSSKRLLKKDGGRLEGLINSLAEKNKEKDTASREAEAAAMAQAQKDANREREKERIALPKLEKEVRKAIQNVKDRQAAVDKAKLTIPSLTDEENKKLDDALQDAKTKLEKAEALALATRKTADSASATAATTASASASATASTATPASASATPTSAASATPTKPLTLAKKTKRDDKLKSKGEKLTAAVAAATAAVAAATGDPSKAAALQKATGDLATAQENLNKFNANITTRNNADVAAAKAAVVAARDVVKSATPATIEAAKKALYDAIKASPDDKIIEIQRLTTEITNKEAKKTNIEKQKTNKKFPEDKYKKLKADIEAELAELIRQKTFYE